MINVVSKTSLAGIGMALAIGFGLASPAQAAFSFNPTGGATVGGFNPGTINNATTLGFGPGNLYGQNAQTAINNFVAGTGSTTFTSYFQTALTSVGTPTGSVIPAGLNSAYQITEVAQLQETVQSVTTSNGVTTATFALAPSGVQQVSLFFNPAVTANNATGTGFTDGTEIARLTPTSLGSSQYSTSGATGSFYGQGTTITLPDPVPGVDNISTTGRTLIGSGSSNVNNNVNFALANFFPSPVALVSITNLNVSSQFDSVAASARFTMLNGSTLTPLVVFPPTRVGAVNAQSGPDIAFQVSGITQSFTAVPEPASVAMTVIGLGMGLGTVAARRRRVRAKA